MNQALTQIQAATKEITAAFEAQAALQASGISAENLPALANISRELSKLIKSPGGILLPQLEKLHGGVLVLDHSTGLVWDARPTGKSMNQKDGAAFCAALDLHGYKFDLPTNRELLSIVDDSKVSPAIDTEFFPGTKNDYYWTKTDYAGSSAFARVVLFSNGNSYWGARSYNFCVRAVARPRQS